ncbi:MAG: tetratricopeptide repeat protein [Thermoanaerobaculia bacterium]|nr:tetratricopeptide repeat protein [Thermoanaerobaculia bacterium]
MPPTLVQESLRPYSEAEACHFSGLTVRQVRRLTRDGLLSCPPEEAKRVRLSFEDLVVLKAARGLLDADVPAGRLRSTLRRLRRELPDDVPLSGLRFECEAGEIVVGDGSVRWLAASGQTLFDFEAEPASAEDGAGAGGIAADGAATETEAPPAPESAVVAHLWESSSPEPSTAVLDGAGAADWFELGLALEDERPDEARYAYRRALALDGDLVAAHLNLGRLLHQVGDLRSAERHYRQALEIDPGDGTAAFNVGVVLEDLGLAEEALAAYERAAETDPGLADAYHNALRICERRGEGARAVALLKRLREQSS